MQTTVIQTHGEKKPGSRCKWILLIVLLFSALFLVNVPSAGAQSTLGSFLGTVHDSSGAVIPDAIVKLTNVGTSESNVAHTDKVGAYVFPNVPAGTYQITVEAKGFETTSVTHLTLQAHENQRVDLALTVGSASETVTVEGAEEGVVNTEDSSLSVTATGRELQDLPVGLATRISASTSAFSALATEPGVQAGSTTSMVIAGATSAMQSVTVDGVSDLGVETSSIMTENLPSFNGISEMQTSEINNNAEYSGVVDVTIASKSGTNQFHGGLTENYNSKGFNSDSTWNNIGQKPNVVMNNFGAYGGGPLSLPRLYNGHNKTFYFIDYEGLRFPQSSTVTETVPTSAMQSGNICAYMDVADGSTPGSEPPLFSPSGTQYSCSAVPVSTTAAAVMKYLYPKPNVAGSAVTSNYSQLWADPTRVDQGDLRVDQVISPKHSFFGRITYKYIQSTALPANPEIGAATTTTAYGGFVLADNYTIKESLVNEVRFGTNGSDTEAIFNSNNATLLTNLDINNNTAVGGITPPPFNALPAFAPGSTESAPATSNSSSSKNRIIQIFDNLTWLKGRHTFKFGADGRREADFVGASGAYGSTALGSFTFNGTSVFAKTTANPSGLTGDAFAEFLEGYPDSALLAQSTDPGMSGWAYAEAFYAQDSWNVTSNLTLNYGLRWEVHPALQLHSANATGFDANYFATINGNAVHGAVVAPNASGLKIVNPAFAASIAPTPILTASQDGIPSGLRFTDLEDWGPRIGFAWRMFHNDKTVLRGGWGRFIEPPMGASAYFNWGVATTDNLTVAQSYSGTAGPSIAFPYRFLSATVAATAIGTQDFEDAYDPHYRDSHVDQYNLTFERDLGYGVGMRLSYMGSMGKNLAYPRDLNQIAPNTVGYTTEKVDRPYPLWNYIDQFFNGGLSKYNSLSAIATKRLAHGVQFQSSFAFTRDLSNAGGGAPTSLPGGTSPGNAGSWGADPMYDYGNVTYDRRFRLLNTFIYELPFGTNKPFFTTANPVVRSVIGGWQLAGIVVDESGVFIQATDTKIDPSGTGQGGLEGNYVTARLDVVPDVSPHATSGTFLPYATAHSPRGASEHMLLNPAGFQIPAPAGTTPPSLPSSSSKGYVIGRFADEPVGYTTGPGENNVSLSAKKIIDFPEHIRLELGCAAANAFNHKNLATPQVSATSATFGAIGGLLSNTSGEAGGPRIVQFTGRITF